MPENGEELKTKDYSTISISFCLHTVSIQYSCPHLYSLKHNDLSAVWCCVPALYPYTTVLGGLSQTMHQNFQQAVSNIFTKPRGSKIYIYMLYTVYSSNKNQLDATLCRFYFCRVTLHVSGVNAHHQEYLKLVQRPLVHVLSLQVSHHITLLHQVGFYLTYMHGNTKLKQN